MSLCTSYSASQAVLPERARVALLSWLLPPLGFGGWVSGEGQFRKTGEPDTRTFLAEAHAAA